MRVELCRCSPRCVWSSPVRPPAAPPAPPHAAAARRDPTPQQPAAVGEENETSGREQLQHLDAVAGRDRTRLGNVPMWDIHTPTTSGGPFAMHPCLPSHTSRTGSSPPTPRQRALRASQLPQYAYRALTNTRACAPNCMRPQSPSAAQLPRPHAPPPPPAPPRPASTPRDPSCRLHVTPSSSPPTRHSPRSPRCRAHPSSPPLPPPASQSQLAHAPVQGPHAPRPRPPRTHTRARAPHLLQLRDAYVPPPRSRNQLPRAPQLLPEPPLALRQPPLRALQPRAQPANLQGGVERGAQGYTVVTSVRATVTTEWPCAPRSRVRSEPTCGGPGMGLKAPP